MLDWYSGFVGYGGSTLKPDSRAIISYDGVVKWTKAKLIEAQGSYDDKIYLSPDYATSDMLKASKRLGFLCYPTAIYLHGNPTKYLQGHNVFGPSVSSLAPVLIETIKRLPDVCRPDGVESDNWVAIHRTRVDVNVSVAIGSHNEVHEYLTYLRFNTRSRNSHADDVKGTVYWQKSSSLWSMKAYCKACELKHRAPPRGDKSFRDMLIQYCEGQIRIELTLRTLELAPLGTLTESLVWDYFAKLKGVNMTKRVKATEMPEFPRSVEYTLSQWYDGVDVKRVMSPATFYRHRSTILEKTNNSIDVSIIHTPEADKTIDIDIEWLKAHEIKAIPSYLQSYLFKPKSSPIWSRHGEVIGTTQQD